MEDIYKYCDKIVENRVMSQSALEEMLKAIAGSHRPKPARAHSGYDTFMARARTMNRRACEAGVEGRVTPTELRELYAESGKCKKCGSRANLVFDHINPLYKGGKGDISNIQVLCRRCNMEKGVNCVAY